MLKVELTLEQAAFLRHAATHAEEIECFDGFTRRVVIRRLDIAARDAIEKLGFNIGDDC